VSGYLTGDREKEKDDEKHPQEEGRKGETNNARDRVRFLASRSGT
jgi:hypothetical protein